MSTPIVVELASPQFKANPYPAYARLREEAPVFRTKFGRRLVWLVTRYDDVLALLHDERFVKNPLDVQAKQPWVPPMFRPLTHNMLDLDAPDHTRLRALVQKAFTPRLIEQLRPRIQALTEKLLANVERDGRIELVGAYALPVPLTIIAELFGVPPADHQKFHRWTTRILSGITPSDIMRAIPAVWSLLRYLRKLVVQRRAAPRDDLLGALVQANEAGDSLSDDELLAMIFLLLSAGHETTVNLIGSGVLTLLQHPQQCARLRHDPALIKTAVEELARFNSPVECATERYAREDVLIHDVLIRRGEMVLGVVGSANRDPHYFPDPDTLDLARDPNRHLAFGMGTHYCLGAPLARLEAQVAITTLLERWPKLHLTVQPQTLRWRPHPLLRGLKALPLAF